MYTPYWVKYFVLLSLFVVLNFNVLADDLKTKANNKFSGLKDSKIKELSNQLSENIVSLVENNFKNVKHLEFEISGQEHNKPTFNILSVTEMLNLNSGTIFNQTSINTHDKDETINIGFGIRKLLNDNTLILGANTFYDRQFSEQHERVGMGAEAISSIMDIRGNYYNATSGRKINDDNEEERALDGWDLRGDYHLPVDYSVDLFVTAYEFENPEESSTFKDKGNKFGANATIGNFIFEGGYVDDNQNNDDFFASIKLSIKIGDEDNKLENRSSDLVDVSDKLYQPVKRENKIRVVRFSKSGIQVSGF